MAIVVDSFVVVKERVDHWRHVNRGENIRNCDVEGGVDELGSGTVNAVDVNGDGRLKMMVVFDGNKAAGKWVEMEESGGEGVSEAVKKIGHKSLRRFVKEEALLNVLSGKHEKIQRAQMIGGLL